MAPARLLCLVTEALNDLEIPYFVTGSVASSVYGEVRDTADVDIVAEIEERHILLFRAAFPEGDFYLSEEAMRDAIRRHGQFNIIDSSSGYKADIVVPAKTSLNSSRFRRARRIRLGGDQRMYWFSAPEDVILKKLEAHREGGSDKHLRDITGIIRTMGDKLDRAYIEKWAAQLEVADIWRSVVRRAETT